jgi:hypothetical protein
MFIAESILHAVRVMADAQNDPGDDATLGKMIENK